MSQSETDDGYVVWRWRVFFLVRIPSVKADFWSDVDSSSITAALTVGQ